MKRSAVHVILCGAFALLAAIAVHAHAGPMVTVPAPGVIATLDAGVDTPELAPDASNPVASPTAISSPQMRAADAADTEWDMVRQYGPIWGGMLAFYGAAATFLRRNEQEHWLKQGRMLAIITAIVGVLFSVLEAGVNGGSWAGVLPTLFMAIKLVLSPTTPQPTQAPS